jgi:hypothetical protein
MATERNIDIIMVRAFSVLSISINPTLAVEPMSAVTKAAPSNSNTIETVVDVGRPSELNRSSRNTSLITTAK